MSTNKLMEFRVTYLRAIAKAWAEPDFENKLLNNPTRTLLDYFGFDWGMWENACTLQIVSTGRSPGRFDRRGNTASTELPPMRFEWIGDEWVWSKNLLDSMTMYLPLTAPSTEATEQAMALADYYRQRASLFSDDWGTEYGPIGKKPVAIAPAVGTQSNSPVGGFVPTDQGFEAFKVVLLAAIAKAWASEDFKQMLLIDSAAAMQTIRGYKLPWNMNICIMNDDGASWTKPDASSDPPSQGQSYWTFSRPHTLTLYLPTAPSDENAEPVALAVYNATGAEYPFTCCC
ncbi:BMA_0021/BMA_0022 family TOMM bacteriocin [Sorangium sp. So ce887]|uniref:BMA_0021/BMA_0022 family TOMM bacteriocin n=1 Tax=Sorangium sp. So ce887 TaxID=3133324 RepID=UPI003F5FB1BF